LELLCAGLSVLCKMIVKRIAKKMFDCYGCLLGTHPYGCN
jgi:hypothetical protein